jgi:hypothetical protein
MVPLDLIQRSALSIRIAELNAQISALHIRNLGLRASEFALGSQLKKLREKSQRILMNENLRCVSVHSTPLFFTFHVMLASSTVLALGPRVDS